MTISECSVHCSSLLEPIPLVMSIQVLVPCDTDDSKFSFCYLFFLLVGSLVLIGGDPGVGKSTLVLQV